MPLRLSVGDDDIRPHLNLAADVLLDGCRVVISTRTNDIRVIDLSTLAVVIAWNVKTFAAGAGKLVGGVGNITIEVIIPIPASDLVLGEGLGRSPS